MRAWVEASCAAQGLAAAVTDLGVVADVAVLLGAPARRAGRRLARRTAQPGCRHAETGRNLLGVEPVEPTTTGADDEMVEDGSHDRMLAMQREPLPPLAQPGGVSDEPVERGRAA